MIEVAVQNGVELRRFSPVTGIRPRPEGGFVLTTPQGEVETRFVVNAAGVDADRVHRLLEPIPWQTLPSRGEYYLLDKTEGNRVSRVIFQCPGPEGKGVLVAPTVHGNLIVGPNAEPVTDRRDLGNTAAGLAFVKSRAAQSVPSIQFGENIRNFSGIRANTDRSDFIIGWSDRFPGFLDLAGIKSPGLTSAPAIGKLAAELLGEAGLPLTEQPKFVDERHVVRFRLASPEEKAALIAGNPAYGRVICRCETITEGGDPGRHPQPGARHHRQRGQAALQRGHGPVPGRLLRAAGTGHPGPGAGGQPHRNSDGPGRQLGAVRRDQTTCD